MIDQLDAADFDDAVTVGRIEARRFGIENDFTHSSVCPLRRSRSSATIIFTCSKACSRPLSVTTTKWAFARFSSSGIWRERILVELLLRHAGPRQHALALDMGWRRHDDDRIHARMAAGLEQQRNVQHDHLGAVRARVFQEPALLVGHQRMDDGFQLLERGLVIAGDVPGQLRAVDAAVASRCRERPSRFRRPPRRPARRAGAPRRRHRRPERPAARTSSPSRSCPCRWSR